MTTYYVGKGGSDSNNGSTWALRKLTLNGAEDLSLSAGDVVIVGPGTYREMLTCDASGSSGGGTIHFMGDPTGVLTDGIGGLIRVTGSDDDETASRNYCVYSGDKQYREFSYMRFDLSDIVHLEIVTSGDGWHIHDCVFADSLSYVDQAVEIQLETGDSITIERCIFDSNGSAMLDISGLTANGGGTRLIQNCVFHMRMEAIYGYCIGFNYAGDFTVRNCTFISTQGVYSANNTSSYPNEIYNCIFHGTYSGVDSSASGELVEDYNAFNPDVYDSHGVYITPGSNSNAYVFFNQPPILYRGIKLGTFDFYAPADWCALRQIADDGNAPDHDIWGVPRPSVNGKRSWGAVQYQVAERETTVTYDSSPASLKMADAGGKVFFFPITGSEVSVSCRVYRETDYSGTNPQMIIRESGQSDRVTTDANPSGQWNLISDTFTPAGGSHITVILVSNNTATSGSYAVYFDAFEALELG